VAEDNGALRRGIARALRARGAEVEEVADGGRATERLGEPGVEPFDVVITDLRLPGADGLAVLRAARRREPRTAVLLMTAYGTIETAVEAMRLGAYDFLQKPFELAQLEMRFERAVDHARFPGPEPEARAVGRRGVAPPRIVGESAALRSALDLAERAAPTSSTVLVTGETGTGKELVASLIHAASRRAAAPFVKVNCAALPETLLESELFGHERGAFTGADRPRVGRFEQADRGTLFLDEVGDMSLRTQAKLLRVLQDGEFSRLGASQPRHADVRLVTATHQDLEAAVRAGSFREDLYFRLHVIRLHLPALRERGEDAAALANHFLEHFAADLGRPISFTRDAFACLNGYSWPGNVRELRNVVERAALLSEGPEIDAAALGLGHEPEDASPGWSPQLPPSGIPWAEVERAVVVEALRRTGFVQKEAAALLCISRRKLNYMIARMGLTHPSWRRNTGSRSAEPADSERRP
jgi:DNA-binding NtrC family response regulator